MYRITLLLPATTHVFFVYVWFLMGKFLVFCFAGGPRIVTLAPLQAHFLCLGKALWL